MGGWIKLHRTIESNKMWTSEPFSRGQAWVDLLLLANHSNSFYYKRGYKIDVLRGQVGRSMVELADRWKWSRGKVQRFLNDLKNEQQIEQQINNVTTIISIVNYEIYQGDEQQIEQQTVSKRTTNSQQTDTYKKEKNVKNEKEFKEEILSYSNEYDDLMLKDFFNYWSEWDKSKTKMRWQMEKTWETNRRLSTWFKRSKDFKKPITESMGSNLGGDPLPKNYGERSSGAVQRSEYKKSQEK